MMKSFLKRIINSFPKTRKRYISLMWKKHILSDWCNTHMFKSKKTVATPYGFTLVSKNFIANRMMLQGTFEASELNIIKSHLQTVDVFVDVGANIGYYSCLARSLSKHVVAFEPQTQNMECLVASLMHNGWSDIELFSVGLSHSPGLLTLYGASGPSASLVKGWAGYPERHKMVIPVNTMDNILGDRFSGMKLFIKIDVEGAEYAVLKGASKILGLSPRPTWLIEICLNEFHPGGLNPDFAATFELFWQHGYEVRIANTQATLVTPSDLHRWVTQGKTETGEFNYLFIPT